MEGWENISGKQLGYKGRTKIFKNERFKVELHKHQSSKWPVLSLESGGACKGSFLKSGACTASVGTWRNKYLGRWKEWTREKLEPLGQNMGKEWTASVQILEEDSGRWQLHARTNCIANNKELEEIWPCECSEEFTLWHKGQKQKVKKSSLYVWKEIDFIGC